MIESKDLVLLQDGTHADPADCSAGPDGVLRHKNGLAVCLYADGTPQTVGRDAVVNKNVEAAEAGEKPGAPTAHPVRRPAPDVLKVADLNPAAPTEPQAG